MIRLFPLCVLEKAYFCQATSLLCCMEQLLGLQPIVNVLHSLPLPSSFLEGLLFFESTVIILEESNIYTYDMVRL